MSHTAIRWEMCRRPADTTLLVQLYEPPNSGYQGYRILARQTSDQPSIRESCPELPSRLESFLCDAQWFPNGYEPPSRQSFGGFQRLTRLEYPADWSLGVESDRGELRHSLSIASTYRQQSFCPAFVANRFSRNNFLNILHGFGKTVRNRSTNERGGGGGRNLSQSIPDSPARGFL